VPKNNISILLFAFGVLSAEGRKGKIVGESQQLSNVHELFEFRIFEAFINSIAKQINTLATFAEMGKTKSFDTDRSMMMKI